MLNRCDTSLSRLVITVPAHQRSTYRKSSDVIPDIVVWLFWFHINASVVKWPSAAIFIWSRVHEIFSFSRFTSYQLSSYQPANEKKAVKNTNQKIERKNNPQWIGQLLANYRKSARGKKDLRESIKRNLFRLWLFFCSCSQDEMDGALFRSSKVVSSREGRLGNGCEIDPSKKKEK